MDRQNHLISLVAIFLSLGIGMLIGASMGVNALVLNQVSVIEQLQDEIRCFQNETSHYVNEIARLNQDINNWQALESDYLNPFFIRDKLSGYKVRVLCQGSFPGELKEFLDLAGCRYQALLFKENINWDEVVPAMNNKGKDPVHSLADYISGITRQIDTGDPLPAYIEEILGEDENGSSPFPGDLPEAPLEELFFAVDALDPFLTEAVAQLSSRQKAVIFITRVDGLPERLKLLESIRGGGLPQ